MLSTFSLRLLAIFIKDDSETFPDRETDKIGNSAKLISSTFGSSAFFGKSFFASSTACRTSSKTRSISSPASNSTVMDVYPSVAAEVIFFKPVTVLSSFSNGFVNNFSASDGDIPS